MTEKKYEEYAVLNAQIKALTNQRDEIKVDIIKELVDEQSTSKETAVGKFTITNLKTWTYTNNVIKLEENYKALKATEESTGDATYVEKPSLRFTQVKL